MATAEIKTQPEPELNLLLSKSSLQQPLWRSLFQNLDDYFFPKKQPPLVLTSKPVPVKDIWGFYDYKKNGALGSTVVHVLAVALIIGGHHPGAPRRAADHETASHRNPIGA